MSVGKESENTQPRKPWALYLQLAIRTLTCKVRNFVNMIIIESLSRRRFCQHGRQPEVNRAVIDGEWWRQPFSFEISNGSHSAFTFVISNENGWRHHSPSITTRFTSGWRPCWQKRRLLKLSNMYWSLFFYNHCRCRTMDQRKANTYYKRSRIR